jgi:hypothetical protein
MCDDGKPVGEIRRVGVSVVKSRVVPTVPRAGGAPGYVFADSLGRVVSPSPSGWVWLTML